MTNYTMTEKLTPQSNRDGINFTSSSLTEAKRKATRNQVFERTFLELTETDTGNTVAVKEWDGKWIPQSYFNQ